MLELFIFSFLFALTGALMPGPLLTFTIYKSIKKKRGYLEAIYILLGHATIELLLIVALLAGASFFIQNIIFISVVGILGGIFLVIYGTLAIKDVLNTDVNIEFGNGHHKGYKGNSYLGGIIVSISNPYWELWWVIISLEFFIFYNISFANPIGLLLFFLGHELGDIVWYLPISIIAYFGGKSLNPKIFKYVLICLNAFMIIFGTYFAISIVFNPPTL